MGMFKKLLLVHVYSGLKYKFCENINEISPVAFTSALGSLDNNNNFIKTDIFKPILMLRSPQNRYFCWRFKIKYFTITMLLYTYSILCELVNTKQDNHLTPFWRLKRVFNAWTACLVFMMEWWRFMLLSTSELFLADRMFWKSISWDPAILSAVVVAGTNSNKILQNLKQNIFGTQNYN